MQDSQQTTAVEPGTGSFFEIGLALLAELAENASRYTSAQRTEIYQAAVAFCYIPMLQAERAAMDAAGGFDLDRAREARREGRMFGEGNGDLEARLVAALHGVRAAGVFSGGFYDDSRSLYSNCHFVVSSAHVALRDAAELVAGLSAEPGARAAQIRRAREMSERDHMQPDGSQLGLMTFILACISDRVYGASADLAELFGADVTLVAMGPVELSPREMREKADAYAEAILKRIPGQAAVAEAFA